MLAMKNVVQFSNMLFEVPQSLSLEVELIFNSKNN